MTEFSVELSLARRGGTEVLSSTASRQSALNTDVTTATCQLVPIRTCVISRRVRVIRIEAGLRCAVSTLRAGPTVTGGTLGSSSKSNSNLRASTTCSASSLIISARSLSGFPKGTARARRSSFPEQTVTGPIKHLVVESLFFALADGDCLLDRS